MKVMESVEDSLKKYKTKEDVYEKYPLLKNLDGHQINWLGLESFKIQDYEFASACRALILLDREKFDKPEFK